MRSTDRGASWDDHRPGAQRDVHSLAWHPRAPGRAYEAAGGGAAWSQDGGDTWRPADDGRDRHYTWSVAVDPDDPDLSYVSASTGPRAAHGRGNPEARIFRRREESPWERVGGGLPEPLPAMPYALVTTGGQVFRGARPRADLEELGSGRDVACRRSRRRASPCTRRARRGRLRRAARWRGERAARWSSDRRRTPGFPADVCARPQRASPRPLHRSRSRR